MSTEILNRICDLRSQFDDLCNRHSDDESFMDAVHDACKDFSEVEKIKESYQKDTDTDRLLRIGIVGRVKVGKSSLLNSLIFDGKDILPKAATPMTAALTYLEYGEKVAVTVEFFTEGDIKKLKENAEDYEKRLKNKQEECFKKLKERRSRNPQTTPSDSQIKEDAIKQAEKEIRGENLSLSAAYDQYQRIERAGSNIRVEIERGEKIIPVNSIDDIASVLTDYVGESGPYMPFTRNVNIRLPLDVLKEVTIVDTPGFNDPVPSRDDKARELLSNCDVVLILSPANQMLSKSDTDVLSKITTKDGIQEIFIVASQFDNTLFGGEVKAEANGKLEDAVESNKIKLSKQIKDVLSGEINSDGVFNTILKEGEKRIFHSSGLCQAMLQTWESKASWDEGRKKVWSNLSRDYADYFSDNNAETSKHFLEYLGNIAAINGSIESVKIQKKKIFKDKLEKFEQRHITIAQDSKKQILEYVEQRKNDIKTRDLEKLTKEIESIEEFAGKIRPALKDIFADTIDGWYFETRNDCKILLKNFFSEAKGGIDSAEGSDSKSWTTGHLFWKKHHSETFTTVKTATVKDAIRRFIQSFNADVSLFVQEQNLNLIRKLSSAVAQFWGAEASEESMSIHEIRNAVRSLVASVIDDEIKYAGETSFSSETGILTDSYAEDFLDEANEFIGKLESEFTELANDKIKETKARLSKVDFAKSILEKYEKILETKKKEAEAPKLALENLQRIQKEVEAIEC
ncbi:dynamin family protein [Treponema phagedenis]|uniref:Dynamin N-terminal domain-containing protein n=1 Tax=Treponema phagedenis TaxID=162 RepID=A0A0B7GTM8_TREPH|nr:dynamin family protein [Treponema phagedenis]NVP22872.1 dynamin family protein [Treponema phagedenis]QEJ94947.1 hypothetical protein FUT79_06800 [Treponema phagedenis]QEJ98326.1 hypothetical protein FUT82_10170 [Treponema phagedenis]QEK00848.1 hypothetical protein FUT84_06460 [Treponema phagedenis]QEK03836.1 hypothetical protein FUT83_08480 [Treponema phagedenis]